MYRKAADFARYPTIVCHSDALEVKNCQNSAMGNNIPAYYVFSRTILYSIAAELLFDLSMLQHFALPLLLIHFSLLIQICIDYT